MHAHPPVSAFIAVRGDHTAAGRYFPTFLDLDTLSATSEGARQLAAAHDASEPCYGKRFPLRTIVTTTITFPDAV